MTNEIRVFLPDRKPFIKILIAIALLITLNIYAICKYSYPALWIPAFILSFAFFYILIPIIQNQRLLISGSELGITSFGKIYIMDFKSSLHEIVVQDSEIVSYRFETNGKYFQASPESYCEPAEVRELFASMVAKYKLTVKIVAQ